MLGAIGALSACAAVPSSDGFAGERTVFHNPYASLESENGPVGPECDGCFGNDGRWLDGLVYVGGDYAFDRKGNRVRLSRNDRRALESRRQAVIDRAESNRSLAEDSARGASGPPEPVPSAPAVSAQVSTESASARRSHRAPAPVLVPNR